MNYVNTSVLINYFCSWSYFVGHCYNLIWIWRSIDWRTTLVGRSSLWPFFIFYYCGEVCLFRIVSWFYIVDLLGCVWFVIPPPPFFERVSLVGAVPPFVFCVFFSGARWVFRSWGRFSSSGEGAVNIYFVIVDVFYWTCRVSRFVDSVRTLATLHPSPSTLWSLPLRAHTPPPTSTELFVRWSAALCLLIAEIASLKLTLSE